MTLVAFLIAALPVLAGFVLVAGMLTSLVLETHFSEFDSEVERGRISVIVPLCTDAPGLQQILTSLERQNTNRFEVVLVDDGASDEISEVENEFSRRFTGKVQIATIAARGHAQGKRRVALRSAVEAATGDILLFTEAACTVPVAWVRTLSRPFRNPHVGVAFGPAISRGPTGGRGSRVLAWFQPFEQTLRFQFLAATAGLGLPVGAVPMNCAVRREAIRDAGGIADLSDVRTEQSQIAVRIRSGQKWDVRVTRRRGLTVVPAAEESVLGYLRAGVAQTARILYSSDRRATIVVLGVMVYTLLSLVVLPFSIAQPLVALPAASAAVSTSIVAIAAGVLHHGDLRYWLSMVPMACLALLYYSLTLVGAVLFGRRHL